MKTCFSSILFLLVLASFPAHAQFTNVLIGDKHAPEEVSICINPKNTSQITAGANLNNAYYSTDGGLTWSGHTLSSEANGVYGDPVLFADTSGTFYFSHLSNPPGGQGSWVDRIVFQRSVDGGRTYSSGTSVGKNGIKVQDKPGTGVNPFNNEIYLCWTQFDVYGSHKKSDSSIIFFSKSTDQAETWSSPKRISPQAGDCLDSDSTVEGCVPSTGPLGEIYTAWAGPLGLAFNKSVDDGNTWMAQEKVVCTIPGGWDYPVSGLFRCNGLPMTACDLSKGPNRGTIYINWSDQRNGVNDADVWIVRSTNGGADWSAPVRVNTDPPGHQNFMSWMTIDQNNGDVYVVYYDRRNFSSGDSTDFYLSRSVDGGHTFADFKLNNKAFVPSPAVFFGDYVGISVVKGMVRPIWMQYEKSGLSIWTALVDASMLAVKEDRPVRMGSLVLCQNIPNPCRDSTVVHFETLKKGRINLYVSGMQGKRVSTCIDHLKMKAGGHDFTISVKTAGLKPGEYQYTLECGEDHITRKLTVY